MIDRVATSVTPVESTESATEFLVDDERTADGDWERVFDYGTATLYRTRHEENARCPCVRLGDHGCPIQRFVADRDGVTLVFHATDFAQLQTVVGDLRDRYSSVDVQKLLQPPLEDAPETNVFVNVGRLTDRQLEVLRTAYEMGYFERPKRANATEIATELGVSQSTATEHLIAAQRKILGDVLAD